jgi:serine/threonine protein kinase
MTDTDLVLKVGDRIADKYEILAIVGQGRMGTVYKCRHEVLGKIVAVKTLHLERSNDEATRRRFEREARLASRMEHPNLISVSDFGYLANGEPYLIMDFVDGIQLAEILKREGHLDPERTVNLFIQICDGLYHAHQREIIHRDLKPANILVVQNEGKEVAKIVDLGVAKMIQSAEDESDAITKAGEVCGSPLYLSPEQCLYLDLDNRTDIYSLGVCLYECLIGQVPLRASSVYDTLKMHVYNMPLAFSMIAPNLDIPARLEEVVFRCLAKATNDRYENMMQVKHELMRSRKSEFDLAPVNVMSPETLFPKPTGTRTATDIPLPPGENSGLSDQTVSGKQSRQSMSLQSVQQSSSELDRYIQSGKITAEMNAAQEDFSVSAKTSGQDLAIAQRPSAAAESGRQTAQDMTLAARQTSEHLAAGRQTSQNLLFSGEANGPEIPVPGSPNVAQAAPFSGKHSGVQMPGRQIVQDLTFEQQSFTNLAEFQPYSTEDPSLTPLRHDEHSFGQQPVLLQASQPEPSQNYPQAQRPQVQSHDEFASHAPATDPLGRLASHAPHAATAHHSTSHLAGIHSPIARGTDNSSMAKKVMIFIGACLAVGLSMGIGFATFVNKNSNSAQSGQAFTPGASNKAMIPSSTVEPKQNGSSKTKTKAAAAKNSHKNSSAIGKHGNAGKVSVTHSSPAASSHSAPHKASTPQKAAHGGGTGGGVRVVKHPDGRIDVYDNETAPSYAPPPLPRSRSHSRTVSESSSGGVSIRRHADGTVDVIDTTEQRH